MGEVVRDGVDEGLEDGFLVVADNEDFLDLGNSCDGAEAVLDNGVACDREERLWQQLVGVGTGRVIRIVAHLGQVHRQRPEPGAAGGSADLWL
jgi:hypothetical protein